MTERKAERNETKGGKEDRRTVGTSKSKEAMNHVKRSLQNNHVSSQKNYTIEKYFAKPMIQRKKNSTQQGGKKKTERKKNPKDNFPDIFF